jgi:hypothetical protein
VRDEWSFTPSRINLLAFMSFLSEYLDCTGDMAKDLYP